VSGILSYLATVGKFGGPFIAVAGLAIWYVDRRAAENHQGEQSQIDRLTKRVERLEGKVGDQRDKLDEYSRELAQVREKLGKAYQENGEKEARVRKLQRKVEALQQKVRRLEEQSEPCIGTAPTDPADGEGAA